ncbi:MAG TPA: hypothetical protein VNW06_06810 [Cytophagaceae bacterium]|jgi:hypothetical protein|nr:hypothetical protein [Cytophagaceae bacterium]
MLRIKNNFLITFFSSLPIVLLLNTISFAQVLNDNANNAQPLTIDAVPHKSDTKDCTLEEACINRKLTAKCLVYHNDQWFTFTTGAEPVYYLSVRNQDCRDVNGVQLQVIEGHLCKPSTYKILECISLATQDDIYITMNSLKKNHTYILNVDGYLNDFCQFEIGITSTLPDFAVLPVAHLQDLNGTQKNGKVTLEWKLNEELELLKTETFELRRRFESEKKFYPITKISVERFVHGRFKPDYQYADTVGRKGYYYYQVIAIGADSIKHKVGEFSVLSNPIIKNNYVKAVKLPCKDKTAVIISVYNWENNFLMGKMNATYFNNGNFTINTEPFFQSEVIRLNIIITDANGKNLTEFTVDRKP